MSSLASAVSFSLNLWADLTQLLRYDFMQRALLGGTLLSIVAGLIGTFVVLRHQTFAGEALSDVAFTGALGGAVLGLNPLATLLGTGLVVALAMGGFSERLRGRDVAIGTVLAWVLGVGDLLLVIFTHHPGGAPAGFTGVSILFGNLIGTSAAEVRTLVLVSLGLVLMLLAVARPLLFASIDPDVAAARGVPVRAVGLGFMALLAVAVSVATLALGALLVFALLILPAASAQHLTIRPWRAMGLAVGLAITCCWLGLAFSFFSGWPASPCISLLAFGVYVGTMGWQAIQ